MNGWWMEGEDGQMEEWVEGWMDGWMTETELLNKDNMKSDKAKR